MTKSNIIAGLVAVASTFAAIVSPALAASEFSGKNIKATGGAATFFVFGGSVTCESSGGKGAVISKAQAKIAVTFEKCTATVPETIKMAAKISTCNFNFKTEDSVDLEGGCVTEFKVIGVACVITPMPEKNTELKNVAYLHPNEEKENQELNLLISANAISYTVNKICESLGIKGGNEGGLDPFEPVAAKGFTDSNLAHIVIANPTAEERKIGMTNATEYKFDLSATKWVRCGEANFNNATIAAARDEVSNLTFPSIKFTSCKTNVLPTEEPANIESSSCKLLFNFSNVVVGGVIGSFIPATGDCVPVVKFGTPGCTLTFTLPAPTIAFSNAATTPKTVLMKIPAAGVVNRFTYLAQGSCNNLPFGSDRSTYVGESKITAETPGRTQTDVEVR